MEIHVFDLEKLWEREPTRYAKLVAGKGGLNRVIDFYDSMERPDIKPWLRKNLLLITTGYAIRNDKEALLRLVQDLHDVDASALAIKTKFFDEFPNEVLELSDMYDLPLFFVNNEVGFVELTFPVMVAIVKAKEQTQKEGPFQSNYNQMEMNVKLFLDFQMGKITSVEGQRSANYLNWPSVPFRLILLQTSQKINKSIQKENLQNIL